MADMGGPYGPGKRAHCADGSTADSASDTSLLKIADEPKLKEAKTSLELIHSVVPQTEKEKIADKMVANAGSALNSSSVIIAILDGSRDRTERFADEMLRIEAATKILKNNPQLYRNTFAMAEIRDAVFVLIKDGAPVSSKMSLAPLLGELGGKESADALISFINNADAIRESIVSLGKIGHESPAEAAVALAKVKRDCPIDDIIEKADASLAQIASSLVRKNDFYSVNNSRHDFMESIADTLIGKGIMGPRYRAIEALVMDRKITDLLDLTQNAITEAGSRLHPIRAKACRDFLGVVSSIRQLDNERIAPAGQEAKRQSAEVAGNITNARIFHQIATAHTTSERASTLRNVAKAPQERVGGGWMHRSV